MVEKGEQVARARLLTEREREVARLMGTGSYKEIGLRMGGISFNTVANHVKAIRTKLGVRDRYQAAEIVRAWDAEEDSRKTASRSPDLATSAVSDIMEGLAETHGSGDRHSVREARSSWPELDDAPQQGTQLHVRSPLSSLALIVLIAAAVGLILLAMPQLAEGWKALSNFIEPHRFRS